MGAPAAAKPKSGSGTPLLSLLASLIPLLCAIALYYYNLTPSKVDTAVVISALELAASHSSPSLKRVSVGYNSNLDLIVADATQVFSSLDLKPAGQTNHASIASTKQLEETISYFFARGSAGERFIEDAALFEKIIDASKAVDKKYYFIGGNAALMAQRFAEKGCEVHLGGAIGATLKSLLHPSMWSAGSKDVVDEVHLILEYKKGSAWGSLSSPRANRFIIVRDLTNGVLAPLEEFHSSAAKFAPQLIVVSGLHLLEGQPAAKRSERLHDVVQALRATSSATPLHFELASVGGLTFLSELLNTVLPEFDSMGLNEQELGSAYVALGGREYNTSDFVVPTPQIAASALEFLLSGSAGSKRLRRIHFHSLGFHIVAHSGTKWSDVKASTAVAAASLATTRQACDAERIDPSKVDVLLPGSYLVSTDKGAVRHMAIGVSEWTHKSVRFFLAPVLVCKMPLKTVGLGDIISATGLLYSY